MFFLFISTSKAERAIHHGLDQSYNARLQAVESASGLSKLSSDITVFKNKFLGAVSAVDEMRLGQMHFSIN